MLPRQMGLTLRSLRPSRRYSMSLPFQAGSAPEGAPSREPVARRQIALQQPREHAGVAVESVVADFSVGEEPRERHLPETLADQPQLFGLRSEESAHPPPTGQRERPARPPPGTPPHAPQQ